MSLSENLKKAKQVQERLIEFESLIREIECEIKYSQAVCEHLPVVSLFQSEIQKILEPRGFILTRTNRKREKEWHHYYFFEFDSLGRQYQFFYRFGERNYPNSIFFDMEVGRSEWEDNGNESVKTRKWYGERL